MAHHHLSTENVQYFRTILSSKIYIQSFEEFSVACFLKIHFRNMFFHEKLPNDFINICWMSNIIFIYRTNYTDMTNTSTDKKAADF